MTGAASGIGQAVADRLQKRGDALCLLARTTESAERVKRRFPEARTFVADMAVPKTIADALPNDALPDRIDGLIHVAGALRLGAVADLKLDAWHASLTVNLVSAAELTRLLLPRLRHPDGHVVFVNSMSGLKTQAHWAAYSASKYGLHALADALRAEEGTTGMRVTTVYPGRTSTPMQESVRRHEGQSYEPERWINPESVATAVLTALNLPMDAEISDITVSVGPLHR
jgi:short-subunit dehydrogenase